MKVFLSSTFVDLIEHRNAAKDAIERLDLQAGRMETFGARAEEPLDTCLNEIEACDLFVGIYAHRYGFIPEGADHSITEMEYDHAVKLGKPVFCFVLNEDADWKPKFIEKEPGATKLQAFKARIGKDKVCPTFTTPDNLAILVATSLSRHVGPAPAPKSTAPRRAELPATRKLYGRDKELAIIAAALKPTARSFGVVIDGPGGMGKTTLAIHAAHEAVGFDDKIFLSAKNRHLTSDGPRDRSDFALGNLDSLLEELGRALGDEAVPRSVPGAARSREARRALEGRKALLVLDNLETLERGERDRLFAFLDELPGSCKAMLTSRRRDDSGAKNLRLDCLPQEAALALLDEQAEHIPLLEKATPEQRVRLAEAAGGNPLLLLWTVGQLGKPGAVCRNLDHAVARVKLGMAENDPLEFIFGDLACSFTPQETACLAALLPFAQPLPTTIIAELAVLPHHQTEAALETLAARALLNADSEQTSYAILPLAAVYVRRLLPETQMQAAADRLTARVFDCVTVNGYDKHDQFALIEAQWPLVLASIPLFLQGDNARLQTFCAALDFFMSFSGRWDNWLDLSVKAEEVAKSAGDPRKAGWRAYFAGWVHVLREEGRGVLDCAQRCAAHWQAGAETEGHASFARELATAQSLRAIGHRLETDYPAALSAYREALDIYRGLDPDSDDVASSLNDIAIIERRTGDYAAAERDYQEALRIARHIGDPEGIAIYTGNLATLALERQRWADAETLAREALGLAEATGRLQLIASNRRRLAEALLRQNQAEAALPHAILAVEIYTKLGSPDEVIARGMLEECQRALSGSN